MENNEYRFCLAEQEDAEKIAGLMHEVHEGMKNQDHFVCDDLDYVRRHIEEEGFILLANSPHSRIRLSTISVVSSSLKMHRPLQN